MIVVMNRRQRGPAIAGFPTFFGHELIGRAVLPVLFVVAGVGAIGVGAALLSTPPVRPGGPVLADGSCRYPVNEHGRNVCVSKSNFDRAAVDDQRGPVGGIMALFALQTGMLIGASARWDGER